MLSSVRELMNGTESSTCNSRLTLVYPRMIKGPAMALAVFLVEGVVHCWTCLDQGGGPDFTTAAKETMVAFTTGGGREGIEGGGNCGRATGRSGRATGSELGWMGRAVSSWALVEARSVCRKSTAPVRAATWLAREITRDFRDRYGVAIDASDFTH